MSLKPKIKTSQVVCIILRFFFAKKASLFQYFLQQMGDTRQKRANLTIIEQNRVLQCFHTTWTFKQAHKKIPSNSHNVLQRTLTRQRCDISRIACILQIFIENFEKKCQMSLCTKTFNYTLWPPSIKLTYYCC